MDPDRIIWCTVRSALNTTCKVMISHDPYHI